MAVLVKEIMAKPVYTIDIKKTAEDAAKVMRKTRRGFLVVIKNKNPVGCISDSDLIDKVMTKSIVARKIKVDKLMGGPVVFVEPDEDVLSVVKKMKRSNVHRMPVINKGRIVGIISLSDIAKSSPEMLELLEYRTKMKTLPFEIEEETTSGICDNCENYSDDLLRTNDQWLCESCRQEMKEEL
jgi:CBS domain-containing protein